MACKFNLVSAVPPFPVCSRSFLLIFIPPTRAARHGKQIRPTATGIPPPIGYLIPCLTARQMSLLSLLPVRRLSHSRRQPRWAASFLTRAPMLLRLLVRVNFSYSLAAREWLTIPALLSS